jgi:hypothetical protein
MNTHQSTGDRILTPTPGKEKAPRRTGLFPKFLSRSIAHGYDSHWNETATTTTHSEGVNRNRNNCRNIRLAPPVSHFLIQFLTPFEKAFQGGVKTYQGKGGVKTYQVGSTPVLAYYGRCSTPLNVSKDTCRVRAELAHPTLHSRELRGLASLTPVLRTFAPSIARLSLELALPIADAAMVYGIDALTHSKGGLLQ